MLKLVKVVKKGKLVVVDLLFIFSPIVGVCNCSMFCCTLLYVPPSFAIRLAALFSLSSWCLVIVVWLFLAVPWVCMQFVIVVFPDHTHNIFNEYHYECVCACMCVHV